MALSSFSLLFRVIFTELILHPVALLYISHHICDVLKDKMKVLVSGAGIAGSALAFWLSKLGHTVTVMERFPSLRVSGLQLDLRGHAIEVMRKMGLEDDFRARQAPEQGMEIVGSSGMRWAYFPVNKSGKGLQGFTTDFEIMRSDLCRILHDAAAGEGTKYTFGNSIKSFEDKAEAVDVCFQDGSADRFDLVIGADGQGSRTRRMMTSQEGKSDGFKPIGKSYIGYVTIPRQMEKGEEYMATTYMATGGRAIMTRRHSPELTQVYLSCDFTAKNTEDIAKKPTQTQKAVIAEAFKGAGWKSDEIIKGMMQDNDFYLAESGLVKLDQWHKGRIGLVGDAAYCPSANNGMGTSSAMVGAYILAGEIGTHCGQDDKPSQEGLEKALASYHRKFQPFMDQVQKGLLEGEGFMEKMPQSALGITLMNCVVGLASLLKVDIISKLVLREDIKDWDLPDYAGVFGPKV